jgi:hypothetical protein
VKLDLAVGEVQDAELSLAKALAAAAGRHAADADVYHLGHALARASRQRLSRLAAFAERYGVVPADLGETEPGGLLEPLRRAASELAGRTEASGLLLLGDLRALYARAQEAEIGWVVLGQGAKAARDAELVECVEACLEDVQGAAKWHRTKIKESAPQALAAG